MDARSQFDLEPRLRERLVTERACRLLAFGLEEHGREADERLGAFHRRRDRLDQRAEDLLGSLRFTGLEQVLR